MKLLFFLLGFYLLYITGLPCGDSVECNETSTITIAAANDHGQHDHNQESCTPFCTCSCCAASVFFQPGSYTKTIPYGYQSVRFYFPTDHFDSYNARKVWQPPRA